MGYEIIQIHFHSIGLSERTAQGNSGNMSQIIRGPKNQLNLSFFFFFDKQEENIINKRKARETQRVHGSEQWKKKQQDKTTPNLF